MEKTIFDLIPDFDLLLEKIPFRDLDTEKKKIILRFFSEEEYGKLQEMILLSKQNILQGKTALKPNPDIKHRILMDHAPHRPLAARPIFRFLTYRIPLYQAGLAASVLLLIIFYFLLRSIPSPGETVLADTVYLDKIITRKDTVWVEKSSGPRVTHTNPESKGRALLAVHKSTTGQETPGNNSERTSQFALRQMRDAIARIAPLTAASQNNPISSDTLLLKLVAAVY